MQNAQQWHVHVHDEDDMNPPVFDFVMASQHSTPIFVVVSSFPATKSFLKRRMAQVALSNSCHRVKNGYNSALHPYLKRAAVEMCRRGVAQAGLTKALAPAAINVNVVKYWDNHMHLRTSFRALVGLETI